MFKPRIYVDTSVIGGCFDHKFEEYSNRLFEEFILPEGDGSSRRGPDSRASGDTK